MSVNSSATSDSSVMFALKCYLFSPGSLIFTLFSITSSLLLLPLYIMVLYHGVQRWRHQCSSTTAAQTSHSDVFTYHMVTIQVIHVFATILCCCGIYRKNLEMMMIWFYHFCFTWYEETFFQLLTCVEPYLAVVHPIIYLSLKTERGVRMRNVCIGCIWVLCLGCASLVAFEEVPLKVDLTLLISSVIVISFCCLSVLRVLIRPGPGEQARNRDRVDQSKQRAFYTIVVILGVLMLRCTWNLVWSVLYELNPGGHKCIPVLCQTWVSLPSNLVLPLLFLHRAGKLACCSNNIK